VTLRSETPFVALNFLREEQIRNEYDDINDWRERKKQSVAEPLFMKQILLGESRLNSRRN